MSAEDRRAAIMDLVREQGIVRIADLVDRFRVSVMTVRRDLTVLADRGAIEKVHGAGVLRSAVDASAASPTTPPSGTALREDSTDAATAAEHVHVGIIIPTGDYYFPAIAEGARKVFDARGLRRSLAICNYDPAYEQVLVGQFLAGGSTGLLLTPMLPLQPSSAELERYAWLFELPVPVVLLERTVSSPDHDVTLSSVRTDHAVGCAAAVRHLARLGHGGVGLVTHGRSQTASRVIAGWRDAVETVGLDPERSPLIVDPQANVSPAGQSWPRSEIVDAILDQLRQADVTAVIAHGDKVSLALVHYAHARGWQVPDDLSVITYDNELAELGDPPLTAVSPPKAWVGRAAAELILELESGDPAYPARHIAIEPSLVLRDSTGVPRSSALR